MYAIETSQIRFRDLLIYLNLLMVFACTPKKTDAPAEAVPNEVVVYQVGSATERFDTVRFSAFVRSKSQVQIVSQVKGHIRQWRVVPGQSLSAGELLAVIVPSGTGFEFQAHSVHSPSSGKVIAIADHLQVGTAVEAGSLLATIANPDQLEVAFQAAAEDAPLLSRGTELDLVANAEESRANDLLVRVVGRSDAIDPRFGTHQVHAEILCRKPQGKACVLPAIGSYIEFEAKRNQRMGFLVPSTALQFDPKAIFVLNKADGHIQKKRLAKFEKLDDGSLFVRKNLKTHDRVIISAAKLPAAEEKAIVIKEEVSKKL
jgi:multidrug efflux pump subunit AcrA (membrane-fusion protein)